MLVTCSGLAVGFAGAGSFRGGCVRGGGVSLCGWR